MADSVKINGQVYSFASIESTVAGLSFENIKEINYKSSLDKGVRRGRSGKKTGRTRGDEDHEGDITLPKEDSVLLLQELGDDAGHQSFTISVSYANGTDPVITDTLEGVEIDEIDAQNAQGTDPTDVKFALNIMDIAWGTPNGQVRMSATPGAAG